MGSWRWDLDEGEERVDEGSSVFDACELGEAEAFGGTLFIYNMVEMGKGKWSMGFEHGDTKGQGKCLLIYLG